MSVQPPYHSALSGGRLQEAEPLHESYWYGGSVVFKWDINEGLPSDVNSCDLIYGEPPWPEGLKKFDERAGAKSVSYDEYSASLGRIVKFGLPTVMFASSRSLKFMPAPDFSTTINFNGNMTPATFWNGAFALGATNRELIQQLAGKYRRVWDFCCGYGTTGKIFAEAGKSFVMTDYNATCCGFVAKHMQEWLS